MRLHGFLKVYGVLFIDLVPVYKVVLFALGRTTFSSEMSHSSAVEARPFWLSRGSLSLGDIRPERTSVESIWWGSGTSRSVHRDWLISHPSWSVTRIILVLWRSLVRPKWRAKPLPLSKGWERLWGVRRPSVCLEDIDDLSGLGGTDGPSFNFIVIAQFGVEFQ